MSGFKSERDAGFDMEKYSNQRVRVKFQGGRECEGILKGYDKLDNLVLEDCVEYLRDPEDSYTVTENSKLNNNKVNQHFHLAPRGKKVG